MHLLDKQLVALASDIDTALDHPRIVDFHFPTAQNAKSLRGDFCAVRLEACGTGLSYRLPEEHGFDRATIAMPKPGDTALEWVQRFSDSKVAVAAPQRSAALATINALYNAILRRTNTPLHKSNNSFGLSDIEAGDKVGMIGFFPPLVKRLRSMDIELTVIELRRDLEREHPRFIVTTDRSKLAACNKVLCTSTTLLNQTLLDMIKAAPNATEFALLGPSAGCPPDPLFAQGVHALASAQIIDDAALWQRLVQGERLGDARRKCTLTLANLPNTATLISTLNTQ